MSNRIVSLIVAMSLAIVSAGCAGPTSTQYGVIPQ